MGIRKNAKFLTSTEKEDFVKACVLLKADIVNPGAPASDQYSRWDELVAMHRMIQSANAPAEGATPASVGINFGHGGTGSFAFLSWHRHFLFYFEGLLQTKVPGVMCPYWDWTDPAPMLTDNFLGPNPTSGNVMASGFFAADAPGTGANPTPAPSWWPAGLTGWSLPSFFGTWQGPLRRRTRTPDRLPRVVDLRDTLAMTTYPAFQDALESGAGLSPHPVMGGPHAMHNSLHGFIGGSATGHMSNPAASPFDPIFYLHHCNIDRLWAMWQQDGHASVYPTSGGNDHQHRNDRLYPWVGAASGYSTNVLQGPIVMPDFSAEPEVVSEDTLDHRASYGYTYDTMAVIGIGLDRTGSMTGLTPDPMTVPAPDVTKWEAAKRGVSAFLQDCEIVQSSAATYVTAGIKTFRSTGAGNEFSSVFGGTPFGLVKTGSPFSRSAFESAVAGMAPAGGTPLADALQDVETTLVEAPYGGLIADEQRYLAMLTDGLLTSGSPMTSIPDGSFAATVIFAMGFGTGADVDYGTLAGMVAKGRTIPTTQVFHGENAGTIDKFYTNALAQAIGFTEIFDPVLELFAGEHLHQDLSVTSADDALFITAQGMDFVDSNWVFHLVAPDGEMAYADGPGHHHAAGTGHGIRRPSVTARRYNGRLSLMLQRDGAPASAWVGNWQLMAAYKTSSMDAMVMPDIGELLFPVSAGPIRGPRFSRLLEKPEARTALRNIKARARHPLDQPPLSTNHNRNQACSLLINVYARTRLRMTLSSGPKRRAGEQVTVDIAPSLLTGSITDTRAFARLVSPRQDLRKLVEDAKATDLPRSAFVKGSEDRIDAALVLGLLERKSRSTGRRDDQAVPVAVHDGPMHVHLKKTAIPGTYHLGVYVEGFYCPEHEVSQDVHHHGEESAGKDANGGGTGGHEDCNLEHFMRLLTTSVAMQSE